MKTSFLYLLIGLLISTPGLAEEKPKLPERHHLVEVPVPAEMELPSEFQPGKQGELVCATCHGIEDIEKLDPKEVDKQQADFLHGGPYRRLTQFCFRCHDEAEYQRPNIHKQLLDSGEPDEAQCKYCHLEIPDRDNPPAPEELQLRLAPERLCLGCHLKTPHLNALVHQAKPKEKMAKRLERLVREKELRMPLDGEGRVTCITCHTPHEPGLIGEEHPGGRQVAETDVEQGAQYVESRWSPIFSRDKAERLEAFQRQLGRPLDAEALTYRRLDKEVLLRLPAKDGSLCKSCHEFED